MKTQNFFKSAATGILILSAGISNSYAVLIGTTLPVPANGSLWITALDPNSQDAAGNFGINAIFPNIPNAIPDLTFTTNRIQYDTNANTISAFLSSGSVMNPVFSNQFNPILSGQADANTLLLNNPADPSTGWGTFIEFSGFLNINNGDHVKIDHDDGVSLRVGNIDLSGCFFTNPPGGPAGHYSASNGPQSCIYNGPSGLQPFDLVYTEGFAPPASLSLAVPEPTTTALMSIGLVGIAFGNRRKHT